MAETALKKMEDEAVDPRPDGNFARQLRGFGLVGLVGALLVCAGSVFGLLALVRGCIVLLWGWASRTPWVQLGYVRPKSWFRTIASGIVLGAIFKLTMKAVVMPLFGADPINRAYHFVVGNTAALPALILTMILAAGLGEETFYRGFLFERLGKLLGTSPMAKIAVVLITTAVFAAVHYPEQGIPGVEQAAITGLFFGTAFAITRRLPAIMIAHASFDLTALAIIYWDLEARVAHVLFK